MITTKIGLVAAGVAAITGAYSTPAHAWGWHGGVRVGYSRPYVGVRAPYVAPYAYGAGYGYGYAAPVAYGADYGYGYGYGAPVVNVGWNRPVYGYGHAGYGWGGGRGWGGGHGYGGGHFGGGRGRR